MANPTPNKPQQWDVQVLRDWCKGCTLCVEVCKPGVLEMEGLYAVVANLDACTGCRLCEMLCPDFAIEVHDVPADASSEVCKESATEQS